VTSRVSAILLAAGQSRRMGRMKQLLPLGEKPVISHCLDTIADSGINDIVIVANSMLADFLQTVRRPLLTVVFNNKPSSEMAESVRLGMKNVDASSSGILIHLADYPLVSVETMRSLITEHETIPYKILTPACKNKRGHPCLFPKDFANEIFRGFTLKEIVHRDERRIRMVDVRDDGILLDMDTEKDYYMMVRRLKKNY
jgi:molybdenum cofactor cytidylyltransferase